MDLVLLFTFKLLLILSTVPHTVDSKWVEGIIDTNQDWVFITRFCFLNKAGNLYYHLEYPYDYSVEKLLFYYDDPGQWESVYKKDLSCDEKVARLQGNNVYALSSSGSICNETVYRDGKQWVVCEGDMDFSSARERWWYVVVSRCPSNSLGKPSLNGVYLRYRIHMTNGDDLLHREFSADEFYILVIDIIFLILYIMLLLLSIGCAYILYKRQLLHTTYKMYLITLVIWTLNLLCLVIAWGHYGTTGWDLKPLEVVGRILQAMGHIIFMLMLILLAKGYTIVRGRLTKKNAIKMTIFINLYIIATIVLFIWEGVMFDPGLVLYYYESPPGYGMITIILIGWLWFTKAAVFTLKHYPGRSTFYIFFYSIYTVWFWAGPIVTMIAMFAMAKWTREKSVHGVQQFIAYLGHNIFLILTWPSKVNENFPFTIRTSQIDFLKDVDDNSESNGSYKVDSDSGSGPNLDIFITQNKGPSREDNGFKMNGPADLSMFHAKDRTEQQSPSAPPLDTGFSRPTTGTISRNISATKGIQLPPLERAILGTGDISTTSSQALPPIRGTGLPPILPTEQTTQQMTKPNIFRASASEI